MGQNLKNTTKKVFSSVLDSWLPSVVKWSSLKVTSLVTLVCLTLWACTSVWNLLKLAYNFALVVRFTAGN